MKVREKMEMELAEELLALDSAVESVRERIVRADGIAAAVSFLMISDVVEEASALVKAVEDVAREEGAAMGAVFDEEDVIRWQAESESWEADLRRELDELFSKEDDDRMDFMDMSRFANIVEEAVEAQASRVRDLARERDFA